jgi:hypothetical protein
MTKEKLLQLMEKEWSSLLAAFDGLKEDMLQEKGAIGDWSIRDIIVHITTWEEEALKALPLIINRMPVHRYTKYGGIDGFNAKEQERKQEYSLERAKRELHEVHQKLINYLLSIPNSTFQNDKRFIKRIYWDVYGHYRKHHKQIVSWRQNREL